MNLNDKQTQAVESKERVIRVVAGAGSGKTRVLTERIKRHLSEGIDPTKILAITFTNKAANEMKKRVGNDQVNISTIHSLCVKILRQEYWTSNFRILDTDEQKAVLKEVYEKENYDEKVFKLYETLTMIQERKLHRLDDDFMPFNDYEVPYKLCYDGYVATLRKMIAMDFDDLIINTVELFRDEKIRNRWASKYEYILVDEFQDVDALQYELIKDLTKIHNRLFVVGDGDQMIYTWRGAEERIFNEFDKDFPACQTIILNQNYRSTKNILDAANNLIHNNKKRIEKDLFTVSDTGANVRIIEYFDEKEEAETIVSEILANRPHYKYSDNAILYRANYLSKTIEKELNRNKIPYDTYGGYKFFDRKEVKDLLSYLKFIEYKDDITLKRIINTPPRKIGKVKLKSIADLALSLNKKMYEVLADGDYTSPETNSFVELIKYLETLPYDEILLEMLERTNYAHYLDDADNVENCMQIVEDVKEYKQNNPHAKLSDYLAEVTLYADKQNEKDADKVKLMTIHAAKGLEFKNVYVIGMTEGKFPKQNYNFDEEERRLAYVAITRAEENLTLCSEKKGYNGYQIPSVFIDELGGFTQKSEKSEESRNRYKSYWDYY